MNGCREFTISENNQNDDLRRRIEHDMPIAETNESGMQCIADIPQSLMRRHFVIHEAYAKNKTDTYIYFQMNEMLFNISFITENGNSLVA